MAFIGGDFAVSDMTIRIVGAAPATGWVVFGLEEPLHELHTAIVILGDEAHARIDRVAIEGEASEHAGYGFNLIQAIYYQGLIGPEFRPISGSFTVRSSSFRRVASGTPVSNVRNARILIAGNRTEDTLWGFDAADIADSSLDVWFNRSDASFAGLDFWEYCGWGADAVCGWDSVDLRVGGNALNAPYGVLLGSAHGQGHDCSVVANALEAPELGIYLGPRTRGCRVVANSPGTTIVDEGTDNVVIHDGPESDCQSRIQLGIPFLATR